MLTTHTHVKFDKFTVLKLLSFRPTAIVISSVFITHKVMMMLLRPM